MNQAWQKGTFFDNVDVFANSLGYDNAGIVMSLAMIPWDTPEDRDEFIFQLTGNPPKGGM